MFRFSLLTLGVQVPSLIGELRPTCLLAIKQKQYCDKSKKKKQTPLKTVHIKKKKKKEKKMVMNEKNRLI